MQWSMICNFLTDWIWIEFFSATVSYQWNNCLFDWLGSSDLIRRKSTETKREKRPQLSLSERLKMEFGLDDSEEEKDGGKG